MIEVLAWLPIVLPYAIGFTAGSVLGVFITGYVMAKTVKSKVEKAAVDKAEVLW